MQRLTLASVTSPAKAGTSTGGERYGKESMLQAEPVPEQKPGLPQHLRDVQGLEERTRSRAGANPGGKRTGEPDRRSRNPESRKAEKEVGKIIKAQMSQNRHRKMPL